jgi:hypothetical protein
MFPRDWFSSMMSSCNDGRTPCTSELVSLLVHKCVDVHSLALMTVFSLYDVNGDIQ